MNTSPDIIYLGYNESEVKRTKRLQKERHLRWQKVASANLARRYQFLMEQAMTDLEAKRREAQEAKNRLEQLELNQPECSICKESLQRLKESTGLTVYNCGHVNCWPCSNQVINCPVCREVIFEKRQLYI